MNNDDFRQLTEYERLTSFLNNYPRKIANRHFLYDEVRYIKPDTKKIQSI